MSTRITSKTISAAIRASSVERELREYFDQRIADEREKYEMNVASEFQRGRICMLRDLRKLLEG